MVMGSKLERNTTANKDKKGIGRLREGVVRHRNLGLEPTSRDFSLREAPKVVPSARDSALRCGRCETNPACRSPLAIRPQRHAREKKRHLVRHCRAAIRPVDREIALDHQRRRDVGGVDLSQGPRPAGCFGAFGVVLELERDVRIAPQAVDGDVVRRYDGGGASPDPLVGVDVAKHRPSGRALADVDGAQLLASVC